MQVATVLSLYWREWGNSYVASMDSSHTHKLAAKEQHRVSCAALPPLPEGCLWCLPEPLICHAAALACALCQPRWWGALEPLSRGETPGWTLQGARFLSSLCHPWCGLGSVTQKWVVIGCSLNFSSNLKCTLRVLMPKVSNLKGVKASCWQY